MMRVLAIPVCLQAALFELLLFFRIAPSVVSAGSCLRLMDALNRQPRGLGQRC